MKNINLSLPTVDAIVNDKQWEGFTSNLPLLRKQLDQVQGSRHVCATINDLHLQKQTIEGKTQYLLYFVLPHLGEDIASAMISLYERYHVDYQTLKSLASKGDVEPVEIEDHGYIDTAGKVFGSYISTDVTDEQLEEFITCKFCVLSCIIKNMEIMLGNKQLNDNLAPNRKLVSTGNNTYALKKRKGVPGPIGRHKSKRKSRKK